MVGCSQLLLISFSRRLIVDSLTPKRCESSEMVCLPSMYKSSFEGIVELQNWWPQAWHLYVRTPLRLPFFTVCAEPHTGYLLLCIWMISYYFQMLVNVVYIRLRAICYPAIWPIGPDLLNISTWNRKMAEDFREKMIINARKNVPL